MPCTETNLPLHSGSASLENFKNRVLVMTVGKQDVRKSQFLESTNLVYEEGSLAIGVVGR
jgi:hypothetical protein